MELTTIQKILIGIGLICVVLFLFKIISKLGLVFVAGAAGFYFGYLFGKKR